MATFEIVKNDKMKLDIPEFNCDSGLAEHLENYEMMKHLNSFGFTGIIGKPGSGKTSMLISWLTGKREKRVFKKVFNNVELVMPLSSRNSIIKNPFKKHDTSKMHEELDLETMEIIYKKLLASSAKKETTLLILDDVGASMKNKYIQKLLRQVLFNRRHLKVHIVVMLQSYLSIPKEVRKLFTNVIMFKPSKVEFENLADELFEIKKDVALQLMHYVYDKPHQYLFMNVESQRMYKNFDEIIVHDPNEKENNV